MFEAVLFDYGGVITTSPFEGFARYETAAGLPEGLIRRINATNPDDNAWAHYERSDITRDQFVPIFEAEAAALGHVVDAEAVLGALRTEVRPAMVAALDTIAEHGMGLALLTNNLAPDPVATAPTPRQAELAAIRQRFDVIVESAVAGCRKPEPRFYELACEGLGVAPDRCVFLDDLGVNLKPARAMGMVTIKVVDGDLALDELSRVLGFALAP